MLKCLIAYSKGFFKNLSQKSCVTYFLSISKKLYKKYLWHIFLYTLSMFKTISSINNNLVFFISDNFIKIALVSKLYLRLILPKCTQNKPIFIIS